MRFQLLLFLLLFYVEVSSQILNVDREASNDTVFKKWISVADISFSSDKVKKNLLDVSSKIETNRFFKNNYLLVGSASNDITLNGNDVIQNEGNIQLKYRDNDKHNWSNESYVQYQWNGALGMEYRNVIGSNVRKKLFDKSKIDLYSGLGVFFENEQWNFSGTENYDPILNAGVLKRQLLRLNNYWKMAYKINDNLDVAAISYFQFPLNEDFDNLRWFLDLNANIKITKNAGFVIHWDHTYDDYRLVPISNFYYSLNFGIQLKF